MSWPGGDREVRVSDALRKASRQLLESSLTIGDKGRVRVRGTGKCFIVTGKRKRYCKGSGYGYG